MFDPARPAHFTFRTCYATCTMNSRMLRLLFTVSMVHASYHIVHRIAASRNPRPLRSTPAVPAGPTPVVVAAFEEVVAGALELVLELLVNDEGDAEDPLAAGTAEVPVKVVGTLTGAVVEAIGTVGVNVEIEPLAEVALDELLAEPVLDVGLALDDELVLVVLDSLAVCWKVAKVLFAVGLMAKTMPSWQWEMGLDEMEANISITVVSKTKDVLGLRTVKPKGAGVIAWHGKGLGDRTSGGVLESRVEATSYPRARLGEGRLSGAMIASLARTDSRVSEECDTGGVLACALTK